MPEQALYLKWRPAQFEDMIGQEHITRTLQGALRQGRVRHAYLFSGPRGTGKTTTARLLAKAVNCTHPDPSAHPCNVCEHCLAVNEGRYLDLIEIDAASHTGVDDVRDLRDKIAFTPGEGLYKVYIIDEVHRFSGAAFDALLKTLEEPPPHAIFVLATTEIERVPDTIKSRCLPFEFRRVSVAEVAAHLGKIAEAEGLTISPDALELIARQGTGSVRDSISLLDQVVADPDEAITLELAERALGAAGRRAVAALVDALAERNVAAGLAIIHQAVDGGADPRHFAQQTVAHLRSVLLAQTAGADILDDTQEALQIYARQADQFSRSALLRIIRLFNEAALDKSSDWQPQLPLEMALVESLTQPEAVVVTAPTPAATAVQASAAQQPQATAPPDEPEPEPTAPGEPPVIGVLTVREGWPRVVETARHYNRNVPALLDHVTVREVQGNTVILAVPSDFFKGRIEQEEARKVLLAALKYIFEQPLLFRVEVHNADSPASGGQSKDMAASDELVAYAVSLGGEVSEIIETSVQEAAPDEE